MVNRPQSTPQLKVRWKSLDFFSPKPPVKRQPLHNPSLAHPSSSVVQALPVRRLLPIWLRLLLRLQRSSFTITTVLGIVVLAVYGSTVYTQQRWSDEYRELENSQRNERQMTEIGEKLKEQIARQAEAPDSGLRPKTPADLVFVPAAPPRPLQPLPIMPSPSPTSSAIGY